LFNAGLSLKAIEVVSFRGKAKVGVVETTPGTNFKNKSEIVFLWHP